MGGGAPQVRAVQAPNTALEYQQAIDIYQRNAGDMYRTEATFRPQYNALERQMNLENIQAFQNQYLSNIPAATQAMLGAQGQAQGAMAGAIRQYGSQSYYDTMASNPLLGQIRDYSQQQMQAGPDQYMTGLRDQLQAALPGEMQQFGQLSGQIESDIGRTNPELQKLYQQAGAETSAQDLAGIRDRLASDPRSQYFTQTAGQVMGQLGQEDPLTAQLRQRASSELALGGQLSPQEVKDAEQQARAAFSARGMMMSNPAMVSEVLNRNVYSHQRQAERQQFATGISQLTDQQAQERIANAMGVTQSDVGQTQFNLGTAGQMTQAISGINQAQIGLQSGLQGAIADNLARARAAQAGLAQQAVGTYQTGMQQVAGLQGSILDQVYRQQQAGMQGMQYLSGLTQSNLNTILGAQSQGAQAAQMGLQSNVYGTGGPELFQSSGVLSLLNQNMMAQMNAQGAANQMNAQSSGASRGAMIGAGAAIGGSLIVGAALL